MLDLLTQITVVAKSIGLMVMTGQWVKPSTRVLNEARLCAVEKAAILLSVSADVNSFKVDILGQV